jgi:hypothetical protein
MSATRAVAFGLQLDADFPLPGTREQSDPGLPELSIELAGSERLEQLWNAAGASTEWEGVLGDGRELRVQLGDGGARLFGYGDRARFHLDAAMGRLTCIPAEPGLDWQRTLLGKVLPAISVMRGYEALHAASVRGPEGAVAITAPSGMGKSTLALELMARGWPLLADDVLALSALPRGVLAHPGIAQMNVTGEQLRAGLHTIGVLGGERWVAVEDAAESACRLAAVVLLGRGEGKPLRCERLRTPIVPLVPYMLGIAAEPERRAARFRLFAELAAGSRVFRLSAGPADPPAALADELQAALRAPGAGR